MQASDFAIGLLMFSSIGLLLCGVAYVILKKRTVHNDSIFLKEKRKVSVNFWHTMYQKLLHFPVTRRYVHRLRKQFELFFPGDTREVIAMTCKVVLTVFVAMLLLAVGIAFINPSVYMALCGAITAVVINEQVVRSVVNYNEKKLLVELDIFTELVQFHYLQSRMIDEAIQDSLVGKNKLAERHGNQILKVLQSEDLDDDLNRYNNSVTNKFLREFMCICVTTFLYGDSELGGRSRFLESLKGLKERIGSELTRVAEVQFRFRMLPIMCILPMFALEAISGWAISTVSELEAYYHGYYGLIATVACLLACIVCYLMINQLKDVRLADLSDHQFLVWITSIPTVRKAFTSYFNKNYGLKLRCEKMLKQTGSRLTADTLLAKRLLFGVVTIISTVVLCLGMHFYVRNRITSQVTGTGSKSSTASETDSVIMMLMIRGYTAKYLDYDAVAAYNAELPPEGERASGMNAEVKQFWKSVLLADFEEGSGCSIPEEMAMQVIHQYNVEHSSSTRLYTAYLGTGTEELREYDVSMVREAYEQLENMRVAAEEPKAIKLGILNESVAEDVMNRVYDYQGAYFHWYELLIAMMLGVAAFWVPYIWLLYTKRDSQQLMEFEVMQFQALIMILMPIKRMSAPLIMDWMLMFAEIFRPGIHRCIVELPADESKAFNDLIESEPYAPFQDLIRKMQMCDKVGVFKAFYNMEVTHQNFVEHRKQSENVRLETNSALAQTLVFVPLLCVLFVYLIAPFIVESFGQLTTTMYQMQSM